VAKGYTMAVLYIVAMLHCQVRLVNSPQDNSTGHDVVQKNSALSLAKSPSAKDRRTEAGTTWEQ
jgi:hypothetical protein